MSIAPTDEGVSSPRLSVIFCQRTPSKPWRLARALPLSATEAYQASKRSTGSFRPHNAQCAACHQVISRCGLPYQLL
ncbi:DUF1588 domain-containing protein [Flavisolibacter sp. BT320]|nr:DUF1588 domain-containing protein [Flavisolibacter longurius]